MSAENLILLAVAGVAVAAALAAFAIAWRRSAGADWKKGLSSETISADKPSDLDLPAVPVAEAEAPAEPEAAPAVEEVEEPAPALAVATEQRLVEVSPEEAGVTRRQFFNRALGATFGTASGIFGLASLAFLWPRLSGGFGADVNAGAISDLLDLAINDDGSVTPVFIPEGRAYIVPAPAALSDQYRDKSVAADGVMALYQRCVHLGCRVPWCQTSQGFECPCHGSKYNGIGEYNAGPAPRNLDRFVVEANSQGELIIKTGSIIETPRAFLPSVEYPKGPSCLGGGA